MGPLLEGGTKNAKNPKVMTRVVVKAIEAKPKRIYISNHNLGVKKVYYHLHQKMADTIFYLIFKKGRGSYPLEISQLQYNDNYR